MLGESALSGKALLVIDMQQGVLEGRYPCYNVAGVVSQVEQLQARAREAGVPVIFVQDEDVLTNLGAEAFAIHPAIAPQPGELIIRKRATDAFYGTDLHEQLQARGITQLVVTGAKTQYCVDTTCRSATARGYNVLLVSDAHTTSDSEVLTAVQIIDHTNYTIDGFENLENYGEAKPASEIAFAV